METAKDDLGSISKVNDEVSDDESGSGWDEVDFNDGVSLADSWRYMERDDGGPVDMDVVEKYLKQVEESEGFDFVDYPGHILGITNIIPRQCLLNKRDVLKELYGEIVDFATRALATYNKANQTDFQVVQIEKLNTESCKVTAYYITFSAMDGKNVARKIFQAKVVNDSIDNTFEVEICRLVAS